MVFAPHEDDETIACAGIIRSAILRGDDVKLVMVTNGDSSNGATQARLRIEQTLSALELLGMERDDILYFGYADGAVLGGAYLDPSGVFTSSPFKVVA
jgi:LmbE family N-acetylglucosaminyl deacetylase